MFKCLVDGIGPDEYKKAGEVGQLEAYSEFIGWIRIEAEVFDYLCCGIIYRIVTE